MKTDDKQTQVLSFTLHSGAQGSAQMQTVAFEVVDGRVRMTPCRVDDSGNVIKQER